MYHDASSCVDIKNKNIFNSKEFHLFLDLFTINVAYYFNILIQESIQLGGIRS